MIIRKVKVTEYEYQAPINYVAGATEPDIQFQLTDYEIPSGATGRVYVGRSDGTFEYTVATISGNNVTVAPTSSMFSVKGPGAIQVTLYVGNEVVKNFAVPVYVHADLADDSAEAGSDVTGVFRAAEEQALADFAEDAEAKAAEVIESIPEDYTELTEEVEQLNERLDNLEPGLSDDAKVALLTCFDNVLWKDGDGQDYISALRQTLYPSEYPQIQASLSLGTHTVFYEDDANTLKPYLTVTYYATESSSGVIVPSTDYTLVGSLNSATNTVMVTYNGLHTTVSVNALMPVFAYDSSSGKLLSEMEGLEVFNSSGLQATESLVDGHFLLSSPVASNPNSPIYKQYRIIPNTFVSGMMRIKFNLLVVPPDVDNIYNTMRLRISNGTSGSTVSEAVKSNGIAINYAEDSTIKAAAATIQLNEWHTLEMYLKDGKQTIVLDGTTIVNAKEYSTVGASNNSLFIQNSSTSSQVQFYVDKLQLFEIA